jgi:hypothetical protein
MKIRLSHKLGTGASALLVALVIGSILCVFVVYYLGLIAQQNRFSVRSQAWNVAITISEAGIEEALQHLNVNATNLNADGWTYTGSLYVRSNTLPDGNAYRVTINVSEASKPEIISRAYISVTTLARNNPPVCFAAAGVGSDSVLTRAVRVRCARGSMFTKAMVAKHTIDLNGNNINTDSFDSGDPAHSTIDGHYNPATAKDAGDIASNDTIVSAVSVGNANIHGHVATGPGGSVSVGAQGAVGPYSWQNAGGRGVYTDPDTGVSWVTDDMNFTFPDTALPYSSGLTPAAGNVVIPTFSISSSATNSTTPPAFPPIGGIITNAGLVTVGTLPSPIPAGLTTNTTYITASTLPSPVPDGTATNTQYTSSTKEPAAGTYVGSYTYSKPKYYYYLITGYTYPVYSYTYFTYTYTYNLYSTNVVYTTNHYDYVLSSGDYYLSSLSGSVYVGGDARLAVNGSIDMSGGAEFTIANSGAKIQVYCGGSSCSVSGNAVINKSGLAGNFILYCTPGVTSMALNGNGEFVGVLVAPNVDIRMNGGGKSSTVDFTGALVVNSVTMNGHFNFHYDEALGHLPGNGRVLVTSWEEIP